MSAAETRLPCSEKIRREIRILKARNGWTYDEALTALVEAYDGDN